MRPRALVALLVLLALQTPARAGIGVSPVRVTMPPGQRTASITLTNAVDMPRRVQTEVFRWTRVAGEDVLTPEPGILVNPPLFDVPPGGSQVIRLGFRAGFKPPPTRETAYRIFFQEVPRELAATGQQLQMVLRIGVPVFALPERAVPSLHWAAASGPASTFIGLRNAGNTHVRVAGLRVATSPGAEPQTVPGFVYVFPGESHQWNLDSASHGMLRLDALTDAGPVHVELPVQPQ